jgi:hypothetical protein
MSVGQIKSDTTVAAQISSFRFPVNAVNSRLGMFCAWRLVTSVMAVLLLVTVSTAPPAADAQHAAKLALV